MAKIQVMDEHLANLIAAGEVVERPMNIVKEAIENAIDANASQIDISLRDGGIEQISVRDNGDGMDYEDVALAFERHATSKLKSEQDLFSIATMGFRGEALASIASVAHVRLWSNNGKESSYVEMEYGKKTVHDHSQTTKGTRLEVNHLFSHTPARFKYLKKASYEYSLIAELVNKLALIYPHIRFTLRSDGKLMFQSSGLGDQKEVFYQLYGKQVANAAIPFEAENDDFKIKGLAVLPEFFRANKYALFLCVNQRIIRNSQINNAIVKAYENFLPVKRYPICYLEIEVDPQLIDVNVHPGKWQVRFAKEKELNSFIEETLKELLKENLVAPYIQASAINYPNGTSQALPSQAASRQLDALKKSKTSFNPPFHEGAKDTAEIEGETSQRDIESQSQNSSSINTNPFQNYPNRPAQRELIQTDQRERGRENNFQTSYSKTSSMEQRPAASSNRPVAKERLSSFGKQSGFSHDHSDRGLLNPENKEVDKTIPQMAGMDIDEIDSDRDNDISSDLNLFENQPENLAEQSERQDLEKEKEKDSQESYPNQSEENQDRDSEIRKESDQRETKPRARGKRFFKELKVIGQLKECYILCESAEGLAIIDQHAAQERYNYERLVKALKEEEILLQPVMVPLVFKVSPQIYNQLELLNEKVEHFGLHFSKFGKDSLMIGALPIWMEGLEQQDFLQDILGYFESDLDVDIESLRRKMVATMACHQSIRFHQALSFEEMEAVIEDLQKCEQPYHCPHGRPTIIVLSEKELFREFERG